jgi:hypothetical protein
VPVTPTARSPRPGSLKEITRDLYRVDTVKAAREVLELLYAWADSGDVAQMRRFARTVRRWQTEILAWHATDGASNGPTEAVNLLIKKIKRVGHSFRNFDNYRLRLLLHCAWPGKINPPRGSGAALHVSWRRAVYYKKCL